MRKFVAAGAAGALTAAAFGLAPTAAADSAEVVVSNLQTQGYQVQWLPQVPRSVLPQCSVKGQHPSSLDPSAIPDGCDVWVGNQALSRAQATAASLMTLEGAASLHRLRRSSRCPSSNSGRAQRRVAGGPVCGLR